MVNSDKRQRHKDGHRSRMEEARIAQARARRIQTLAIVAVIAVVVVGVGVFFAVANGDDDQSVDAGASTTLATDTTTTVAGTPTTKPAVKLPVAPEGASIKGATPCPKVDGSSKRTTTFAKAPPTCIDKAKTYVATIKTSEGDIVVALDTKQAPIAVNNFVVLARYHYYEGSTFHRIVPGFVDQTGGKGADPGTSGPGYDLPMEKPTREYAKSDVAMAASSAGPSGSQFFLTIDPAPLNSSPNYPLFGTITTGMDVVLKINQFGQNDQGGTGAPTKVVTIDKVTIAES